MAEKPNFRDHLPSIIDTENKSKWMYPQIIQGKLYHQYSDQIFFHNIY